jgi:hypothetical protein
MTSSNELLRLLAQERQHLVDQPLGLSTLQSCRSSEVFHQFVQVGRLSVVHANFPESLCSWKDFARFRAKRPASTCPIFSWISRVCRGSTRWPCGRCRRRESESDAALLQDRAPFVSPGLRFPSHRVLAIMKKDVVLAPAFGLG